MKISVIIPTYNSSKFIAQTLDSVLRQTHLPDQILVVDDCSSDNTIEVIQSISNNSLTPIKIIRLDKNSGGPARPLNIGISSAAGSHIALLDHDDLMQEMRIENQANLFKLRPEIGLSFGYVSVPIGFLPDGTDYGPKMNALPKMQLISGDHYFITSRIAYQGICTFGSYGYTCSSFMFRKDAWTAVKGFDERIKTCCDFDILSKIAKDHDIAFTATRLAIWNRSPATLLNSTSRRLQELDEAIVYTNLDRSKLKADLSQEKAHEIASLISDSAYQLRQLGQFRASVKMYLNVLKWRFGVGPFIGILKLLPKYFSAIININSKSV